MMTRAERLEYEVLDCALSRTRAPEGWLTSLEVFLIQLRDLFLDVGRQELIEVCKRLAMEGALTLRTKEPGHPFYHDYRGELDDATFFQETRRALRFQEAPMSQARFNRLADLIEPPVSFQRSRRRRR